MKVIVGLSCQIERLFLCRQLLKCIFLTPQGVSDLTLLLHFNTDFFFKQLNHHINVLRGQALESALI